MKIALQMFDVVYFSRSGQNVVTNFHQQMSCENDMLDAVCSLIVPRGPAENLCEKCNRRVYIYRCSAMCINPRWSWTPDGKAYDYSTMVECRILT